MSSLEIGRIHLFAIANGQSFVSGTAVANSL